MRGYLSAAIALLALGASCCAAGATMPGVTLQTLKGSYEDVKERVVTAIENRGLVIDHTANVGGMLERTGKDIGRDRRVYLKAEVIEFCSAAVSRTTMEADPRNLVFCPYAIALYVLPAEPDKVYLIYRKPLATGSTRSMKALREIGKLLDGIARDALK
jgi:uncharacterized protein (DUF302 family)